MKLEKQIQLLEQITGKKVVLEEEHECHCGGSCCTDEKSLNESLPAQFDKSGFTDSSLMSKILRKPVNFDGFDMNGRPLFTAENERLSDLEWTVDDNGDVWQHNGVTDNKVGNVLRRLNKSLDIKEDNYFPQPKQKINWEEELDKFCDAFVDRLMGLESGGALVTKGGQSIIIGQKREKRRDGSIHTPTTSEEDWKNTAEELVKELAQGNFPSYHVAGYNQTSCRLEIDNPESLNENSQVTDLAWEALSALEIVRQKIARAIEIEPSDNLGDASRYIDAAYRSLKPLEVSETILKEDYRDEKENIQILKNIAKLAKANPTSRKLKNMSKEALQIYQSFKAGRFNNSLENSLDEEVEMLLDNYSPIPKGIVPYETLGGLRDSVQLEAMIKDLDKHLTKNTGLEKEQRKQWRETIKTLSDQVKATKDPVKQKELKREVLRVFDSFHYWKEKYMK